MPEDTRLRELYATTWRDAPATPHLEDEDWELLACGELSEAERRAALDHIGACPDCAQIYRGLLLLSEEAQEIDAVAPQLIREPPPEPRRRKTVYVWSGLAAAAALLLIVALNVDLSRESVIPQIEDDPLRSTQADRPRALAPVGSTVTPPAAFTWEGVASADSYRLEVLSAEGEPIWESDVVGGTSLAWPDDLALGAGRYYWRVRALSDGRSPPSVSELAAFDLGSE